MLSLLSSKNSHCVTKRKKLTDTVAIAETRSASRAFGTGGSRFRRTGSLNTAINCDSDTGIATNGFSCSSVTFTKDTRARREISMGRRRKGRHDVMPFEFGRRRWSFAELFGTFVSLMIIFGFIAPIMLRHRQQLNAAIISLVRLGNSSSLNIRTGQHDKQSGHSALKTKIHASRAVNGSAITLGSRKHPQVLRQPDVQGENVARMRTSMDTGALALKTPSNSFQRRSATTNVNKRETVGRIGKDKRVAARSKRMAWWKHLHHRVHTKIAIERNISAYKVPHTGQIELTKKNAQLGRQNVVRDHVGRIVEPGSHTEVNSDRVSGVQRFEHNGTSTHVDLVGGVMMSDGKATENVKNEGNVADMEETSTKTEILLAKKNAIDRNEYLGSLGGTTDGMIRGQNVTKLSVTLFKILKLFGFSSVTDSPAGAHAEWMGDVALRLTYEQPLFRYVGVDETSEGLKRAKASIGDSVDAEFELHDIERELGNATDVLFHWTELDGSYRDARHSGYLVHVRKVLRTARQFGFGHIIFPQLPRLQGIAPTYKHGKWTFVGHKDEEPFLFNDHVRGAVPVGNGSRADVVYLTFYSLRAIPQAQLDV